MRRVTIPYILVAVLLILGVFFVFYQAHPQAFTHTSTVMGTYCRIVVVADTERSRSRAAQEALSRISSIESLANTYNPDSEISQLSDLPPDSAGKLSTRICAVLARSLYYYQLTDGAFDVTVGPVMKLWRAAAKRDVAPTAQEIAVAMRSVGSDKITLDPAARTIAFSRPGKSITLDAIVKGYAADQALAALYEEGVLASLVDIGGDIVCFGCPPGRDGWHIGIQNPFQPAAAPMDTSPGSILATICLTDAAVATSGNYQRTFEIQGKSYSQIIDPRTGYPVAQAPSVTVIAPTAADADALATACSVLSVRQALDLINRTHRTEALLITGSAESPAFHISAGFDKYLLTPLPAASAE